MKHSFFKTSVIRRTFASEEHRKIVKGIVLGVYEKESENDPKLTPTAEKFDDRVQGRVTSLIKEANITGAVGKGVVFHSVDREFRHVAVIGLGAEGASYNSTENLEEGMENVRIAAGVGARALQKYGCTEVHVDSMEYPEQAAEGSAIAIFRYQDNKRKQYKMIIPNLELYESPDLDAWTRGLFKAEAQNLARRLTDAPANQITPTIFAQAAVDALCPCGVTVEVRTINWIEHNHLNSFLAVAKGACEPPIFLEISYCGTAPEDKPILLVGKGITFDSGGLSLKSKDGMDECRGSMAGAGVVVAAIRAAAALSLPINIAGIIPLCENVPSGMACKPGDVITCLNSKTMGVTSMANAGVIALADPIVYAQHTYKPKLILDLATLEKRSKSAFAEAACGVFSNSDYLWKQMYKAGTLTGDRVWRMPLWKYYRKIILDNVSYDIDNKGCSIATSCTAAAVLNQFIPCIDWIHLDITGVGMLSRIGSLPYLLPKRMTGRPTRTVIQFLYQIACPEEQKC